MLWVVLATGDRGDMALVAGHWWALVAGRHDRDRWWWLRKSGFWLVDDAKSNVGNRRRETYIYLITAMCLTTALWSTGSIVALLSCDISLAVGLILLGALIFAYYNNSRNTDALLSSVQLSVTQRGSVHSALSVLISADQH